MNKGEYIKIRGANAHNLKNVDVDIPRGTFTVVTGISGSGKSSLAFDTIYAEGQRRYLNTLSPYAKHFMGILDKPQVESIEGEGTFSAAADARYYRESAARDIHVDVLQVMGFSAAYLYELLFAHRIR